MAGLVDQWGRPIDFAKLKERKAGADVMGVRSPTAGHPADGLTPVRLAQILRQAETGDPIQYLELAEQMEERYPHYLSVLGTRKRAVAQLEITVEAADTDKASVEMADFVREWVGRDELEMELFDLLDAMGKGFSVTEIVWDLSGNTWTPDRLIWTDPRFIDFDQTTRRTPMLKGANGLQPLEAFGFIVHTHVAKSGLPIRGGLARAVAWAYLFQNYSLKDWVAFAEVYGLPLRVGRYDNGETPENIRTLMNAVAAISSDAAAVFPKSMDVEFITGDKGGSSDLFDKLNAYLDRQVSKAVIGQTATTDADTGGLGSGKEHGDVRQDIRDSDAKILAATLSRDLIRPMIDLNYGPQKRGGYPRLKIGEAESWDPKTMIPVIKDFVAMGGKVSMAAVRDKIGLEDPDEDEELLQAPKPTPAPVAENPPQKGQDVAPGPGAPEKSSEGPQGRLKSLKEASGPEGRAATWDKAPAEPQADAIDQLIDDGLSPDWEPVMQAVISPIEELIASCSTLEEVRERLPDALASTDATAMAELLARAGFMARLAGHAGLSVGGGAPPATEG